MAKLAKGQQQEKTEQMYFSINQFNELLEQCKNNYQNETMIKEKESIKKQKEQLEQIEKMKELGLEVKPVKPSKAEKPKKEGDMIFPELEKYLKSVIFPTKEGTFFFWDKSNKTDKIELKCLGDKSFLSVYGKHLAKYNKNWELCFTDKYEACVDKCDYVIDKEKHLINLAKKFNYSYIEGFKCSDKSKSNAKVFFDFLKNIICDGVDELYDNLMHILSCYSHREQSQIVIWIVGYGGTGKSMFGEQFLGELFGESCEPVDEQFFKDSSFNSRLMGKTIAVVPETSGKGEDNYREQQRTIKQLSTSSKLTIRKLYQEAFSVDNLLNIVLLTNKIIDVFPDRRNFILEPSTKFFKDCSMYSNVAKVLDDKDAMQHIFNTLYLYNLKTPKFNIFKMKLYQHEAGKSISESNTLNIPYAEFLFYQFVARKNDKERMTADSVYEYFPTFCKTYFKSFNKFSDITAKQNFRQLLEKAGMTHGRTTYFITSKSVSDRLKQMMSWDDAKLEELKKKYSNEYEDDDSDSDDEDDDQAEQIRILQEQLKKLTEKKEKKSKKTEVEEIFEVEVAKPKKDKSNSKFATEKPMFARKD